jgi:type III pantothenate kinase
MKILCIDVGNTSIHFGLVDRQTVTQTGDFPTAGFMADSGKQFSQVINPLIAQVEQTSYCSVVPAVNSVLESSLRRTGKACFHLSVTTVQGLQITYPKPEEIGEDRLANALAAQTYHGVPAIVIDMGTAVTFDIVTSKGYEGGIIAPGLGLMTSYLHEQTALLPELKPEDLIQVDGAIGKSTRHAMQLGVAIGYSGMLDALCARVINELSEREKVEPIILATGGSIANLTNDWAKKSQFAENLTLQGLAIGL